MSLNRHPKLSNTWVAVIYPNGRKKDPKTGKPSNYRERVLFEGSEVEAREWYRSLLQNMPCQPKAPILAPTIDQAYNDFMAYYKNKVSPRTLSDFILTYARHLKPFFGHYKPFLLTSAIFEQYKTMRAQDTYLPGKRGQQTEDDTPEEKAKRIPITKRTVQKEISYMQAYLRWMSDPDVSKAEPIKFKIKNYKSSQTEAPPKIIPSRREMILLIRACRDVVKGYKKDDTPIYERQDRKYRALFAIAYYSGLRRSELFSLSGNSIDRQQGYFRIKGKGGKIRTVPIVTRLKPYIEKLKPSGRVFTSEVTGEEYDNVNRLLARACDAAGMPLISMHTFRHAFAVHAIMRGVNLRTLQLVMGHSSITTTQKYLLLVPADLKNDLDKVPLRTAPRKKLVKALE